ncbi:MAG TPA: hypothetical protein VHO68_07245, partial [Bacteroidales bacterium]|nr:hypothetical protein [Bacteroidales bacterium]
TGAISEERLGHVVKNRRKEIFLSTKVSARDPEKAKQHIGESLKRLLYEFPSGIMRFHSDSGFRCG